MVPTASGRLDCAIDSREVSPKGLNCSCGRFVGCESWRDWLLCLMQLAPAIALVTAIMVDEGPTGEARVSSHFFPLVLWIFDDFAWTCARNSLIFAVVVSLGSLVLGLGLRCALDRVWLPARSPAGAAALAAVVLSPAFLALGLTGLLDSIRALVVAIRIDRRCQPGGKPRVVVRPFALGHLGLVRGDTGSGARCDCLRAVVPAAEPVLGRRSAACRRELVPDRTGSLLANRSARRGPRGGSGLFTRNRRARSTARARTAPHARFPDRGSRVPAPIHFRARPSGQSWRACSGSAAGSFSDGAEAIPSRLRPLKPRPPGNRAAACVAVLHWLPSPRQAALRSGRSSRGCRCSA